jgi:hypothetical protein
MSLPMINLMQMEIEDGVATMHLGMPLVAIAM